MIGMAFTLIRWIFGISFAIILLALLIGVLGNIAENPHDVSGAVNDAIGWFVDLVKGLGTVGKEIGEGV